MIQRITHPVILKGKLVTLIPLEEAHFPALLEIGKDPQIWEFYAFNGADPAVLLNHLMNVLQKRTAGEYYPFTVIDNEKNRIIGTTNLSHIAVENRKLEIGATWYDPAYWRKGYNRECKLLLLTYCFEQLKTIRVQLITADNNERSRQAISGIGATFEGILRNERIKWNGEYRNTAVYSIIDTEWPGVQKLLTERKLS